MTKFLIDVEAVARAAHEVNRAYCISIGDLSQVSWDEAPEWQKQGVMPSVMAVLNGATPKKLHDRWVQAKTDVGWKYGPVKNPDTKEHPCLVPYEQLPEVEKVKDMLFHSTVKSVMKALEVNMRVE